MDAAGLPRPGLFPAALARTHHQRVRARVARAVVELAEGVERQVTPRRRRQPAADAAVVGAAAEQLLVPAGAARFRPVDSCRRLAQRRRQTMAAIRLRRVGAGVAARQRLQGVVAAVEKAEVA